MTTHIHPAPDAMRRLRSARQALGVAQHALAARAGYTREEVCQWELGRRQIKLSQFEDLAGALGVRLELVFSTSNTASVNVMTDSESE